MGSKTKQFANGNGIQEPVPIRLRKRDMAYLIFFMSHLMAMLAVDLVPLYPKSMTPSALISLREFYVETFQDKLFTEPHAWGVAYILMEAVCHVPLSIWVIGALIKDHPMVPVYLLMFGVQTFVTTFTCVVEIWSWADRTTEQKTKLTLLYSSYLVIALDLMIAMISRLAKRLDSGKPGKAKAH